ncbi:MAG: T9SS type A sorting domain-containing protein [candidate division WOR-3 bacterium]
MLKKFLILLIFVSLIFASPPQSSSHSLPWEEDSCLTPNMTVHQWIHSHVASWATHTPDNKVYCVWCRWVAPYPTIMRWWNQMGSWAPEETVSQGNLPLDSCYCAGVAGDSNNNIHLIWGGKIGTYTGVFYRAKLRNGSYTNICSLPIKATSRNSYPSHKIAGGKGDTAHCAFTIYWGSYCRICYAKIYPDIPTPTVIKIDTISPIEWTRHSYSPHIAVDGQNRIHIVWYANIPVGSASNNIFYRMRDANGVWSQIETISVFPGSVNNLYPRVAIDNGGNIHVVWQAGLYPVLRIAHRVKTTSGWSEVTLIPGDYERIYPTCAVDAGNNLHVVCQTYELGGGYNIVRFIRYPDGTWEGPDTVTCFTDGGRYGPEIIATREGNLHLFRFDNASYTNNYRWIYYKRYRTHHYYDVGATKIISPTGINYRDTTSKPVIGKVKNFGNTQATFWSFFKIYKGNSLIYLDSIRKTLESNAESTLNFTPYPWASDTGEFKIILKTFLPGDTNPDNDSLVGSFQVIPILDVGATYILSPPIGGRIERDTTSKPVTGKVKNFGDIPATFWTYFKIYKKENLIYSDSIEKRVEPNAESTLNFTPYPWASDTGEFTVIMNTGLVGDVNPSNDTISGTFRVIILPPGWYRKADVSGATKPVKSGAGLCVLRDTIYAIIGNNTSDLMIYDIKRNTWSKKGEVPFSYLTTKKKYIKKGAAICTDGQYIYILKGNNTNEFWRYKPEKDSWKEWDIGFTKRVKGGSMAYDGSNYIYIISGSNNNEWKRFNISNETFEECVPASLPADKWKTGSWITYVNGNIYGLRVGGKTNEFYKIRIDGDVEPKTGMPLIGSSGKKKKAKEGSAGVYNPNDNLIYALKGGNTLEFFSYNPETDEWTILDDVGKPEGTPAKKVKGGGSLTYSQVANGLYAFIGNNTNEFWFYKPGSMPFEKANKTDNRIQSERKDLKDFVLKVDHLKNYLKIFYSLPINTKARLKIYNSLGKIICSVTSEKGYFVIDKKRLTTGIYLIKFNVNEYQVTRKLIIH